MSLNKKLWITLLVGLIVLGFFDIFLQIDYENLTLGVLWVQGFNKQPNLN